MQKQLISYQNISRLIRIPALAAVLTLMSNMAEAKITILHCKARGLELFITVYDDGTPARIGRGPGVGDKALVISDVRTGALVIVEQNMDQIPISFTTLQPDMTGWHARQTIDLDGQIIAPSQAPITCKRGIP